MSRYSRRFFTLAAVAAQTFALAGVARADMMAPPSGVVSLSASATIEVPKDMLQITFSTTKDGADAASVQTQLKQALDAALAEARKAARPGQVDVKAGNFSLYPRYTNKGVANGWQGTTELVVEGRDMQAIGQLAGRISTLTIGRVGYSLSRELRERSEAEVSGLAIASFRGKAAEYAKQFGYAGYSVREVNVQGNEPSPPMPMQAMRMKTMSAAADESLPVEPGQGAVSVTVNGTVQMNK